MATVLPIRKTVSDPLALRAEAIDNLNFIRSAMENANSFTAVPGIGSMLMGSTALVASWAAHRSGNLHAWLAIWILEAFLAFAIALWFCYRKAISAGTALLSRPFRRFVLAMSPSVFAGAVITVLLYRSGGSRLLPPIWLLLYGVGVSSAGAFSVRIVPIMGSCFLLLGGVAAYAPFDWSDPLMALGFGGLHLVFGFQIARQYGG